MAMDDTASPDQVANGLMERANELCEAGQLDEALSLYDDVIHFFGATMTPAVRLHVARAYVNKALILVQSSRPEDTLAACEEALRQLGGGRDPRLREGVVRVLLYKCVAVGQLGRNEEARAAFDRAIALANNAAEAAHIRTHLDRLQKDSTPADSTPTAKKV